MMRLLDTPETRPAARKAMIGRIITAQQAHIPYFISFSDSGWAAFLSSMISPLASLVICMAWLPASSTGRSTLQTDTKITVMSERTCLTLQHWKVVYARQQARN